MSARQPQHEAGTGDDAWADLVAILEELHDVLVRIDDGTVNRRYTDFAVLAKRLEGCIEAVERLPKA